MKLTPAEKLIIQMLADTMTALKVPSDLKPEFITKAISTGNTWAISARYHGFDSDSEPTPDVISHVHDVLQLWSVIERSVAELSPEDRAKLETEAEPFGKDPKFRGFDGNHEGEYRSAAKFMVDELDYHEDFKGRADLNSHMGTIETFERMKPVFDKEFGQTDDGLLTVDQIVAVLKAQTHPSYL